jgi:nucleoside 2-deoxyribosyltransferase
VDKVYLAGPIFQQSDAACNDWRAKFKACELYEWLDPMRRDFRGREDECFAEIVEGDKEDVDSCAALVAKVSQPSAGTSMEILWAWLNHTPVITIAEGRVSPWVRYHSEAIVPTEEAALAKLQEILA